MQENASEMHSKFIYGQKNGVLSLTSTEIVARFNVSATSIIIPWKDVLGVHLTGEEQPRETSSPSSPPLEDQFVESPKNQPEVFKSRTFVLHPFVVPISSSGGNHRDSSLSTSSCCGIVHHQGTGSPHSIGLNNAPDSPASTLRADVDDRASISRQLDVYYASRKACSEWVVARLSLCHASVDYLTLMRDFVMDRIGGFTERPRTALIFINPYGGRRMAVKIYEKKVAPVFQVAGMKCEVVVTTRRNHAYDHLATNDVNQYGAVVGVGGDGLISEIINGIWARVLKTSAQDGFDDGVAGQDRQPAFPTALGVIPGGSTNTLDYSLNGRSFPVNAAINIALGRRLRMDVMGVYQNDALVKLCFNGIFYGFLGDMMWRSEKLRFLGPPRYNLSGVQTFLGDSSKRLQCEYLGEEDPMSKTSPKCRRQCSTCSHDAVGDHQPSASGWNSISGKFTQVGGMVHSLLSSYSPQGLSPGAHLGDGCLDVICVKDTSKFDLLRFLLMTRFFAERKFDLPFVTHLRVKELRIKPEPDAGDFFNCDGELLPAAPIHCKVFRQLLEVFSHGNDLNCPLEETSTSRAANATTSSNGRGFNFFSKFTQPMRNKKHKADLRHPSASSSSLSGVDLIFSWKRTPNDLSAVEQVGNNAEAAT